MLKKKYFCLLAALVFLTSCQKDIPEPEVKAVEKKITVTPMNSINTKNDLPVMGSEQKDFLVEHHVRGSNVYIECIIPNISLRENSQENKGKIILYVDNKKVREISTAAFIVKGLSNGTHHIRIDVVKLDNSPYKLSKEFQVEIP